MSHRWEEGGREKRLGRGNEKHVVAKVAGKSEASFAKLGFATLRVNGACSASIRCSELSSFSEKRGTRLLGRANVYPAQSTEISSAAVIAAANSARLGSGESTHGGERNIFA